MLLSRTSARRLLLTALAPLLLASLGIGEASALPVPCGDAEVESVGIDAPCLYVPVPQPSGSDPVWNAMPPTVQAQFSLASLQANRTRPVAVGAPTVVEINPPVEVPAAGSLRCFEGFEVVVKGKNSYGGVLWTYHQVIDWCGDGRRVSNLERLRYGETSTPGWHWRGHIGNKKSGGPGPPAWRYRWTQGKFQLCWAWCVQESTPWIDQTVRADGSYDCDTIAGKPSGCPGKV